MIGDIQELCALGISINENKNRVPSDLLSYARCFCVCKNFEEGAVTRISEKHIIPDSA